VKRFFAIVVLALLGVAAAAAWAAQALNQPYRNFAPAGVYVDVPRGASSRTVARLLSDQGVIGNRWLFEAFTR
jgi:cell division protein YceG involved in septum cleavage